MGTSLSELKLFFDSTPQKVLRESVPAYVQFTVKDSIFYNDRFSVYVDYNTPHLSFIESYISQRFEVISTTDCSVATANGLERVWRIQIKVKGI